MNKQIEYALDIVDVTKKFNRQNLLSAYTTLKSWFLTRKSLTKEVDEIVAIKDLRIRIPRGDSVGVIGRNGSGKSTLLKLITGIYKPTSGKISVNGKIASLIELGAGFHPDFTGRENLELGAVLHGLTKEELKERFDQIVSFAELEAFIDQPVRTYSSGMFMRLGFSLAIHTDPEILLIDEVLAVGDAGFNAKCRDRITQLRKSGKTLLLVSHDLDSIERWCDEVIWLDKGIVKDRGNPRRVIDHYREFVNKKSEEVLVETESKVEVRDQERWGSKEIEILSAQMTKALYYPDDSAEVQISYKVNEPTDDYVFGIGISRNDGMLMFGTNTQLDNSDFKISNVGNVKFTIDRLSLAPGEYYLDVAVHRKDGYPYDYHKNTFKFIVRSFYNPVGVFVPKYTWSFE